VWLGERALDRVEYSQLRPGVPEAHWFGPPAGIEAPPPPAPAAQPATPPPQRPSPLREVGDGAWLFANARGGFHPLVVEQEDGLLVVDAPAGWHELQVLPPTGWEGEDGGDAVGRRLLASLGEAFPGTPVRRVVLTHHHNDHTGGVAPFIEAGAEVLAAPATHAVLERFVVPRLPASLRERARLTPVRGRLAIGDSLRPVELIDDGSNPHAEGMLVVYQPAQRILFQSDLFEPLSAASFPSVERLPVMAWFVNWLDDSGIAVDSLLAIHGNGRGSAENLDYVRTH
jgi:glyoxylase-like metal-dependent hydrolase (beta-lactamase superfamily II)